MKDNANYLIWTVVALGIGFLVHDSIEKKLPQIADPGPSAVAMPTDQALRLPAEIKLVTGEPRILQAETLGKRVQWMPLDQDLKIMPLDSKSVWVVARKAGNYRAVAWTSYRDTPTPISVCVCRVEDEAEEKK